MAGQEMHVRWRHHQAGLLSYLRQMLTSEVFVDVTLCCQNKRLKAHRVLLSACSPYLQGLLMAHPSSDHATIILHDVTYEDMRALLDFVYTGGVTVPEHRLPSFLEAAHTLQITVLTDKSLHQQVPSRLCEKNIPPLIKVHQDRPYFFQQCQQPYKDACIPNRNGFKTEFNIAETMEHEQLTTALSDQKPIMDDNSYKVKSEHRTPLRENDFLPENSPKDFNNLGSPVAEYKSFIHSPRHLSPVPRTDSNQSSVNRYDTTSSSGSSPSPDTMDFQWVRPLPSLMPISASTALHQRRLGVLTQKHPRKSLGGILTPSPWAQNGRPPVGAPRVIRSPGRGTEKSASGEESDHQDGKSNSSPNYHQMEGNGVPRSPMLHEASSRSDGDSSSEPPSLPRENDENRPHVNSDPSAEVTRLKERRLQDFYRDQLLSNGQGQIGELPFKPPVLLDKIHRYSEQPFFPVNKLHHISRILNVENGSEVNPLHGMKTLASLLEDSNSGGSTIPRRKSLSCSDLTDDTEPTGNDSNNNEGLGHRCGECGKVCDTHQQLTLHQQSPECLACSVCGKQFTQRAQWTAHQRQHEETRQEHACNHCTKTFVTRASLKVHMRTHTGEKPFHCLECGKQFSQLRNYKYHRSVHEGTREFAATCPECGKYFNDRGYLSSHMKIHRNRKEYGCEFCGKSFNQRVAYNMHVRIHTGEKPHSCPHCSKSFSRKMLLKQHLRIHTGEKPFTCVVCQKAFADRSNMTLHMRLHSGVKPYTCSVCSKSFTKKHHLKTHMNYHTGVKPYSCSKCGLRFSQSSNMRTHFKKCSSSPVLSNSEHASNPNSMAPLDMTLAPAVPTPPNSDESSSATNITQDNIR